MTLHAFGTTDEGLTVTEVSLALSSGLAASILDRGAVVRDLKIPTRNGASQRLVLGYRDLAGYCADQGYLGALAGRHANRIAAGRFTLDGKIHQLTLNERGRTHLHGGLIGFSRRGWRILEHTDAAVTLGLTSPAGEEGYPGTLEATCTYRLVDPGTLSIHMTAQSDLPTIVNFAHHSYFTLNYGHSIRDHLLQIDADHYTPTDAELIPTGALVAVADTPFDFRHLRPIAAVEIPYDINFVLRRAQGGLYRAARLLRPGAGIAMEVYTTEPGLQFYDGSYLRASHPGLDARPHFPHAGLCLEPGRFPDGPNHPNFPSPVLRPGEVYRQTTEYRFLNTD